MMNMKYIKEKLIELFAKHSTTEIEQNLGRLIKGTFGISDYRQLNDNEEFQKYFEALKELRDELDIMLNVFKRKKDIRQVKFCLSLINDRKKKAEKDENKVDYFQLGEELVRRGIYLNNWDEKQHRYFDTGIRMMKEWKDFFLSYTNRNCRETNNDFEEIIRCIFGQDFYEKNKDNSNCVAHLIFHYLDLHNLKCFFDKQSMKCGDILEEKILKYCESAYVFIQLVEMATFKYPENKTNWCYEEFKEFDQWVEDFQERHYSNTARVHYNRFQFLLTVDDEDVFPVELHGSYEKWRDKIKERLYIGNLKSLSLNQLRKKMGELAWEIKNTRDNMLMDYYSLDTESNPLPEI